MHGMGNVEHHSKNKWDKVFKNGVGKICERQRFKTFYMVRSWILFLKC